LKYFTFQKVFQTFEKENISRFSEIFPSKFSSEILFIQLTIYYFGLNHKLLR